MGLMMFFKTKLITAIILMLAMLTQVFASSLSCAHHANQLAQPTVQSQQEALTSHAHLPPFGLHTFQMDQHHHEDSIATACHSELNGFQMSSEECHCTAFMAFELIPEVLTLFSAQELSVLDAINVHPKPASGFITSIYHPPLNA